MANKETQRLALATTITDGRVDAERVTVQNRGNSESVASGNYFGLPRRMADLVSDDNLTCELILGL